jgi:tetratricopeptide (TPR) repeat protein
MKRRLFTLLFLSAFAPLVASTESGLLHQAREALAESIPQVAVQKLRALLAMRGLSVEERAAAQRELGAALFAAGQSEEALQAVETLAGFGDPAARLVKARILSGMERWSEALPLYRELVAAPMPADSARLGLAESLAALGQAGEAVAVLEAFVGEHPQAVTARLRLASLLIETGDLRRAGQVIFATTPQTPAEATWKRYLEGRRLLKAGQAATALAIFDELSREPQQMVEGVQFGAALGASEAVRKLQGPGMADTPLEQFIARSPASPFLDAAFQRLDQIYAQQDHPSETELRQWSKDASPRVAALARFYGARMRVRAKNPDGAMKMLNQLIESAPESPLVPSARLMQADLLMAKGDLTAAVEAVETAERQTKDDAQRAEIELRKALVHYRQGEWLLAANSFHRAGERSAKLRPHATFDAALAALALRNYDGFFADYQALSAASPDNPLRSVLLLEQGLTQARTGDARAAETLELFLHHFPHHPRQGEARLALAELAFATQDRQAASRYLRAVNDSAPDRDTTEHAAYLGVFVAAETSPAADAEVIERAKAFLRDYPKSALAPEVRMKLGQLYVRAGDHANAETQFTLLAQEQATGPHAEAALFLAGQSAARVLNAGAADRALALFSEVVKREGPLKLYARQQQAIVQSQLGNAGAAVDLYNAILTATPPPEAELRAAALCGKGDNLRDLGRKDPKQIEAAIAAFDELAATPGVTPAWRNQALYKKGQGLKNLTRTEEALTAWYDVLDKAAPDARDYFWYYKAGFDAADLLRSQQQWKSAVGIYEKMARTAGPRAAEAKQLASQLRLEKFLWE